MFIMKLRVKYIHHHICILYVKPLAKEVNEWLDNCLKTTLDGTGVPQEVNTEYSFYKA